MIGELTDPHITPYSPTAKDALSLKPDGFHISSADGISGSLARLLELLLEDREQTADAVVESYV